MEWCNVLFQNMPANPKNICGPIISQIRNQSKPALTQEDLVARLQAQGLDLDRATLAKIETQKRRVYDYEIVALAKALKFKPSILLGDE